MFPSHDNEIEGNIDELRLDGYSDADIQKKLPYSKELIVTKRELFLKSLYLF